MCSLIVLLGCRCRGRTVKRGVLGKGGGPVVTPGRRGEGRGGGCVFGSSPPSPCPKEPRAGLMSSGWPVRKLLFTRTHMNLLFFALALASFLLFTCSASFIPPKIPRSADFSSFNLSFVLCATLSLTLTTASLSFPYFSEIRLPEWKPFEFPWSIALLPDLEFPAEVRC